jgi:hypothetical protein
MVVSIIVQDFLIHVIKPSYLKRILVYVKENLGLMKKCMKDVGGISKEKLMKRIWLGTK